MGIRRITAHHEVATAYMADGYARSTPPRDLYSIVRWRGQHRNRPVR
jgi:hypothetical protein